MFRVADGKICYGSRVLGPASCLLADYNELVGLGAADGVQHLTMPRRIDMVFAAGQRVVAVESKLPADLLSSHSSRRLHRQIRTMLQVADVVCLLQRGVLLDYEYTPALMDDLVRWQALGVILLSGPLDDSYVPAILARYRRILTGRNALAAVVRWDVAAEGGRSRQLEGSAAGWYLRYLRGVGRVMASRLHAAFGSTGAALAADDAAWQAAGANRAVISRRKEAMQ